MLLLIDNYDSFVHNLARYFERLGQETRRGAQRCRSSVEQLRDMRPAAVVLSPGPCTPHEAGASLDIVRGSHTELPILGVCLGHQVIAEALGGSVVRAPMPVHGQASKIRHNGGGIVCRRAVAAGRWAVSFAGGGADVAAGGFAADGVDG